MNTIAMMMSLVSDTITKKTQGIEKQIESCYVQDDILLDTGIGVCQKMRKKRWKSCRKMS